MKVFVSYSGREEAAVRELVADLESAGQDVWLDRDLRGGEIWWETILQQIRACDVLVLALSDRSLRSKPCRAELDYARRLGKRVLGVQVGPVESLRATSISDTQVIDYRARGTATALSLVAAVLGEAGRAQPLPDPLPDPPPVPFEYLMRLGRAVEAAQMSPVDQAGVLAQLKQGWEDEDDEGARHDIENLLRELRSRSDSTYRTVREVDELLGAEGEAAVGDVRSTGRAAPDAGAATADPPGAGNELMQRAQPDPVPFSVNVALGLWVTAAALAAVPLLGPQASASSGSPLLYAGIGVVGVLVARSGRGWGRVLAVVAAALFAAIVPVGLLSAAAGQIVLATSPAGVICLVLSLVGLAAAVVFLFVRSTSAFLRSRTLNRLLK